MTVTNHPDVVVASSVDEVLAALSTGARFLAGGTWLMRSPMRGELGPLVSARGVPELSTAETADDGVLLGALLTHRELASLQGSATAGLARAAAESAFPQVRNVATLGGNLVNAAFPEADLVPALLAADATVRVASPRGRSSVPVADYVASRADRAHDELVVGVAIATPEGRHADFQRITVRAAGEYALANLSVSIDVDGGIVTAARVAIGSVEHAPRLSVEAAQELVGRPLDDDSAAAAARALAATLSPREGLDGPAWYRAAVTPTLLVRALSRLHDSIA